jgi:hypothetical protein
MELSTSRRLRCHIALRRGSEMYDRVVFGERC